MIKKLFNPVVLGLAMLLGLAFQSPSLAGTTPDTDQQFEAAKAAYQAGDPEKTIPLFKAWAARGHAGAQYYLGKGYFSGHGVARDDVKAAEWYRKAADQGHPDAQFNLGLMCEDGLGVTKSYVEAHKWFNLSLSNLKNVAAKKLVILILDVVEKKMTPDQIAEAKKLAKTWEPE